MTTDASEVPGGRVQVHGGASSGGMGGATSIGAGQGFAGGALQLSGGDGSDLSGGSIGITAGASAPEVLINEVIDAFKARYDVTEELVETAVENVEFKVPRVLRETV